MYEREEDNHKIHLNKKKT